MRINPDRKERTVRENLILLAAAIAVAAPLVLIFLIGTSR